MKRKNRIREETVLEKFHKCRASPPRQRPRQSKAARGRAAGQVWPDPRSTGASGRSDVGLILGGRNHWPVLSMF